MLPRSFGYTLCQWQQCIICNNKSNNSVSTSPQQTACCWILLMCVSKTANTTCRHPESRLCRLHRTRSMPQVSRSLNYVYAWACGQ